MAVNASQVHCPGLLFAASFDGAFLPSSSRAWIVSSNIRFISSSSVNTPFRTSSFRSHYNLTSGVQKIRAEWGPRGTGIHSVCGKYARQRNKFRSTKKKRPREPELLRPRSIGRFSSLKFPRPLGGACGFNVARTRRVRTVGTRPCADDLLIRPRGAAPGGCLPRCGPSIAALRSAVWTRGPFANRPAISPAGGWPA